MKIEKIRDSEDDEDPFDCIMDERARRILYSIHGELGLEAILGIEPDYNLLARYLIGAYVKYHDLDNECINGLIPRVTAALPDIVKSIITKELNKDADYLDWNLVKSILPEDPHECKSLAIPTPPDSDYRFNSMRHNVEMILDCALETVSLLDKKPLGYEEAGVLDESLVRKVLVSRLFLQNPYRLQPECCYLLYYETLIPKCLEIVAEKYNLVIRHLNSSLTINQRRR